MAEDHFILYWQRDGPDLVCQVDKWSLRIAKAAKGYHFSAVNGDRKLEAANISKLRTAKVVADNVALDIFSGVL